MNDRLEWLRRREQQERLTAMCRGLRAAGQILLDEADTLSRIDVPRWRVLKSWRLTRRIKLLLGRAGRLAKHVRTVETIIGR